MGQNVDARYVYNGYRLIDLTTIVREGLYRARVAVVRDVSGGPRTQRFLDFETFGSLEAARHRAIEGAISWIDAEAGKDRLSLPTNFG